ncbi:MAG TPA: penicillin-binding transpeptidase domain-containing protein [Candidatus Woesebacteria bacterium]|nr:penicillin-binding transpeptidase domain-containing protein [Candidatus Woesebacteria bacterium]
MNKLPFIEKGQAGKMEFNRKSGGNSPLFLGLYAVFIVIFLFMAIIRLFQLTVVKGTYYATLSQNNRVREVVVEAPRGTISDRKGITLVANHEPNAQNALKRVVSERIYYKPETVSHLIGYRQIADVNDIKKDPCLNKLKMGDKTGKNGIEKLYECDLRGIHGKKLIEVDAMGEYVRTLDYIPPKKGTALTLALDVLLQEKAEELLRGKKGSVIAVKPDTGEVLTLYSNPSFNPQVFEDADSKTVSTYLTDPDKPLYNRALEGVYPPGSVFKMFVVAAGLEEKAITDETTFEDKGVLQAGTRDFHNWYYLEYGQTEGEVDVYKALQRSNDIYFYELGAKLGPEKIKKWAEIFGFNNKTGIGLNESEGIIPSTFWKADKLKEQWYLGDTYNLSIGQGYVTTTPLQVTLATAAFANGGYYCKPMILKNGSILAIDPACKKVPIARNTYNIVREGMKMACEEGGTAYSFFDFRINEEKQATEEANMATESAQIKGKRLEVGCKTGTAENHSDSGKPHAWFTVFAPFDKPEIILTVLVEEGGQGSDEAAPIAKEILQTYFERNE